jgi:hypothetical protein
MFACRSHQRPSLGSLHDQVAFRCMEGGSLGQDFDAGPQASAELPHQLIEVTEHH